MDCLISTLILKKIFFDKGKEIQILQMIFLQLLKITLQGILSFLKEIKHIRVLIEIFNFQDAQNALCVINTLFNFAEEQQ